MLFSRFRVNGSSMEPSFREGDYVIACKYIFRKPKKGDVVVFEKNRLLLIKRVQKVEDSKIIATGDNSKNKFIVNKKDIVGKVVLKI